LSPADVERYRTRVPQWQVTADSKRIRRELVVKDFVTALAYFRDVAALAEREGHHPDLHLTRYRRVVIELWTHMVNGLTENDFIMAAKIDQIPVELQRGASR
jgi:4a-hydroxytetrahydrobiopterin dehydratase